MLHTPARYCRIKSRYEVSHPPRLLSTLHLCIFFPLCGAMIECVLKQKKLFWSTNAQISRHVSENNSMVLLHLLRWLQTVSIVFNNQYNVKADVSGCIRSQFDNVMNSQGLISTTVHISTSQTLLKPIRIKCKCR